MTNWQITATTPLLRASQADLPVATSGSPADQPERKHNTRPVA